MLLHSLTERCCFTLSQEDISWISRWKMLLHSLTERCRFVLSLKGVASFSHLKISLHSLTEGCCFIRSLEDISWISHWRMLLHSLTDLFPLVFVLFDLFEVCLVQPMRMFWTRAKHLVISSILHSFEIIPSGVDLAAHSSIHSLVHPIHFSVCLLFNHSFFGPPNSSFCMSIFFFLHRSSASSIYFSCPLLSQWLITSLNYH